MNEEIFHKILNHSASETEKAEFFTLLENDPDKAREFYHYKNIYTLSHIDSADYRDKQNESFEKFWDKVQAKRPTRFISVWMKYAAIFIMASIVGYVANNTLRTKDNAFASSRIEYTSERGSVSTIKLEDGSTIWLSSGTKLVIEKENQQTTAKLNGEAYFDLIPNPERNFIVDLGKIKIRDIGTSFNVRAYESENIVSATLINGQIDLIGDSEKPIIKVKPGEYVEYNKINSKIAVNQQDPSAVTAWKDGRFVFIDKTLAEICDELESWYNIEIQINDKNLANTKYTSVVKRTTTVEMVLKILSITDQIHYEITDKKEGKDIIRIHK